MKSKIVIIFLILGLLLPVCPVQGIEQPQTMEEAKGLGLEILSAWPGAVKKVWQDEAWPYMLQMWYWAKDVWDNYIGYRVEAWWNQFLNLVGKEPVDVEKEFYKEREEIQKDAWQRFKDLLE